MPSLPPAIIYINGDITYPAAAVFIGSQPTNPSSYIASASELTTLQTQLFIDDTISKAEFDARVVAEPHYPTIIHLRGLRVLVILPTFRDHVNRRFADVVMYLHQGQADIESNRFWHYNECNTCEDEIVVERNNYYNFDECGCEDGYHYHKPRPVFGPPRKSFEIQRLTIYEILRAEHCRNDFFLPFEASPRCGECNYPFFCDKCHTFSGIRICRGCECDCLCGCSVIDNQGIKSSSIHLPNCDREFNNPAFIHRK